MMSNKRASLDFGINENSEAVSIEELIESKGAKKNSIDINELKKVSEQSGFISRESKKRRVRPSSPHVIQVNLKTRDGVKDIFQEAGARLGTFDHTTFENALLALLEKEKMVDLSKELKELIKKD